MNSLTKLANVFDNSDNEILIDAGLAKKAMLPLQRMLDFSTEQKLVLQSNR